MRQRQRLSQLPSVKAVVAVALVTWWVLGSGQVAGQVCSGIGHMCFRTTDCCTGCCEGYQCVDRSFPCSGDLLGPQAAGSNSCDKFFCPVGKICFLVEVCPAARGCPRQPACRRFTTSETYVRPPEDNSASEVGHSREWMLLLVLTRIALHNLPF